MQYNTENKTQAALKRNFTHDLREASGKIHPCYSEENQIDYTDG